LMEGKFYCNITKYVSQGAEKYITYCQTE